MVNCPNCGELVMEGDPYCSHCGATFAWSDEDDEEDYNQLREEYIARKRTESEIEKGNYKDALMTISKNSEFDMSDLQGEIRRHYIKEYMKDHDISIYDEYVSIMPNDIYFLSQIAVIERHHGNLALVDECNRRIDEIKNPF